MQGLQQQTPAAETGETGKILFGRSTARAIPVLLTDVEVKATLRQMQLPICLFGERASDRKTRLQNECASRGLDRVPPLLLSSAQNGSIEAAGGPDRSDEVYSRGPPSLLDARRVILETSCRAASQRLETLRREFARRRQNTSCSNEEQFIDDNVLRFATLVKRVPNAAIRRSTAAAAAATSPTIPLSFTQVASPSPTSDWFVTGSDDCTLALWSASSGERLAVTIGHPLRVNHVDAASVGGSTIIASCANDREAKIWSFEASAEPTNQEISFSHRATFRGHVARVMRCRLAPHGLRMLATASADSLVMLWDIDRAERLSTLDCCSGSARSVAYHPDGSLLVIADEAGHSFLQDLRIGKYIAALEAPNGAATDAVFSPAGTHVLVGGGDGTIHFFDLRRAATKTSLMQWTANVTSSCLVIAAHNDWLSQVSFAPTASGSLIGNIVSSSVDGTLAAHSGTTGGLLFRWAGAAATLCDVPRPVRGFAFVTQAGESFSDIVSVAHEPYWQCWACGDTTGKPSTRPLLPVVAPSDITIANDPGISQPMPPPEASPDPSDDDEDELAGLMRK